jgi:hypothetical protein
MTSSWLCIVIVNCYCARWWKLSAISCVRVIAVVRKHAVLWCAVRCCCDVRAICQRVSWIERLISAGCQIVGVTMVLCARGGWAWCCSAVTLQSVCVCLYMCVCTYVCICMYVCMCVCVRMYVCMYVCVYVCLYVRVYTYICMCICMYVCA